LKMDELTVDLVLYGEGSNFHVPNAPGQQFRPILAQTPNARSPLTMTIKLVEVHHGKMRHNNVKSMATLLVFEFRFQSLSQGRRYKMAKIELEFLDKDGLSKHTPSVVKMAPDKAYYLNKTTYEKKISYGASASLSSGISIASGGADIHWDIEKTNTVNHKARLTGLPSLGKGMYENENVVRWVMEENDGEGDGIPSFLQTAVLLKRTHDIPFQAVLRVESDVDFKSGSFRKLGVRTDEDKLIDPVTFTPNGMQLGSATITKITSQELEHMHRLPVSDYFRVSFSGEDSLPPHIPEIEKVTGSGDVKTSPPTTTSNVALAPDRAPVITPIVLSSTSDTTTLTAEDMQPQPKQPAADIKDEQITKKCMEAAIKAAEAATKAAEAASIAAEAASKIADAVARIAEAVYAGQMLH
jgi:hypothetical protein